MKEQSFLFRLQKHARWLASLLPQKAKHPAALVLRQCAEGVRKTQQALSHRHFPWFELERLFDQAAESADVKVRCPYCTKLATQWEVDVCKTYCFSCSYWGQDPRLSESKEGAI